MKEAQRFKHSICENKGFSSSAEFRVQSAELRVAQGLADRVPPLGV